MITKILVPLDNSATDTVILDYIQKFAKFAKAKLVLVHVAEGFAARWKNQLNLEDSEEIKDDRKYLEKCRKALIEQGLDVTLHLVLGEPSAQILNTAEKEQCDLIAMATHGHRFIKDIFFGSVAETIRHRTSVPILMIKAGSKE